jgi:hypothetical protein
MGAVRISEIENARMFLGLIEFLLAVAWLGQSEHLRPNRRVWFRCRDELPA